MAGPTARSMDMPFPALRSAPQARATIGAALAFITCIALLVAYGLQRERNQLLDQGNRDAATLTALFEENTARTFDAVDVTLEGLAAYVAARTWQAHDPAVRQTMRDRLAFMPTVRALFVIGADGFITHDTDYPKTPMVSLADREYFRRHVLDQALVRALSPAIQSRSGAGWFVAATRRLTAADGSFQGVIVAAVQLDSITRLYNRMGLQPGQQVSLLRSEGQLLARHPPDDAQIGRNFSGFPVFARIGQQDRAGVFNSEGPPLGYDRIVAFKALEAHPLVIVTTIDKRALLAGWQRTANAAAAAVGVLALLTAAATLLFLQRQRALLRVERSHAAEAAATALATLNAKFRVFFEQGAFFSCVLSPEGDVLEVNDAAIAGSGLTRQDVIGRKFWACGWWARPASQPEALLRGFTQATLAGVYRCEASFSSAGGGQRLVELVISPVRDTDGTLLTVAAVGMDITERKHQEETLKRQASDLAHADELRSQFLATLSHELRNVLTPVQNCVQLIGKVPPGSDKALRAHHILSSQLLQLRRLVDDLLDVARVNSGKIRLDLARLDLRELLVQAGHAAQGFMDKPGHRLDVVLCDDPIVVAADASRLQQVFANLLSNAAKYTPPGGHVQLRARRDGHEAIVEVVDDGLGIPVEELAKVFDMFEQVDSHTRSRQGGLGIGLALVQKLVVLHGGHVEASSDGPGCGSTFTVYLPLADAPPNTSGRSRAGVHEAGRTG